ncbi:MAG: macro domain-containing protein [Candidatus Zixiibacteriota bacterium]|nr:MAG: macro domain-containing protein [candidate division Zixibacteria bacterium]
MGDELRIGQKVIRLLNSDITDTDIECFVYYARSDLKLWAGFGGGIAVRGGPQIQKDLDALAPIGPCEAVITDAGELKAKYIIHANGPKFQEEDAENKLKATILNSLKLADEKGIKQVALPAMGTGFYGIPLDTSADVCLNTVKDYLQNDTGIEEIVFCAIDSREYIPFKTQLDKMG